MIESEKVVYKQTCTRRLIRTGPTIAGFPTYKYVFGLLFLPKYAKIILWSRAMFGYIQIWRLMCIQKIAFIIQSGLNLILSKVQETSVYCLYVFHDRVFLNSILKVDWWAETTTCMNCGNFCTRSLNQNNYILMK